MTEKELLDGSRRISGRPRGWTPDCPPPLALIENRLTSAQKHHVEQCEYCSRVTGINARVVAAGPVAALERGLEPVPGTVPRPAVTPLVTVALPAATDLSEWVSGLFEGLVGAFFATNPGLAGRWRNPWALAGAGVRGSFDGNKTRTVASLKGRRVEMDLDDGRRLCWEYTSNERVRLQLQDDEGDLLSGFRVRLTDEETLEPDAEGWVTLPHLQTNGDIPTTLALEILGTEVDAR